MKTDMKLPEIYAEIHKDRREKTGVRKQGLFLEK